MTELLMLRIVFQIIKDCPYRLRLYLGAIPCGCPGRDYLSEHLYIGTGALAPEPGLQPQCH